MQNSPSNKEELRKELLAKRKQLAVSEIHARSERIANELITSGMFENVRTVLSYMPLGNEVRTEKIHEYLWDKGISVYLPYTDENYNILPCRYRKDAVLAEERFQVAVPAEKEFATEDMDVVLLPAVGIDQNGNRIGFGKGCYDRYLKRKNATTVALLYRFHVLEVVPASEYDVPIQKILTEEGFMK